MTPNKEWFDTYKPVWSKWVMMLHAQLLGFFFFFKVKQLLGFGTMKIKMFDGVVRVFSNVRQVPNLRKI